MSVLGVVDPVDCDERGVPLDWERCRTCNVDGDGTPIYPDGHGAPDCPTCGGRGSLKAAAMRVCLTMDEKYALVPVRCEGCGHPMGGGQWDGRDPYARGDLKILTYAFQALAAGSAVDLEVLERVYWSPCDEGCRHGASVRTPVPGGYWTNLTVIAPEGAAAKVAAGERVEASWRAVDVRTLGWPHDLRPEKLAVLCMRCWAERSGR